MRRPYLHVVREKCSQALHILDRFHIVAQMNKALDEVRSRGPPNGPRGSRAAAEEDALVCPSSAKTISPLSRNSVSAIYSATTSEVRAYLLKEDFQQFWQYNSPTWAGMFLDFWCSQNMR
jgi:transposase